MTEVPPAVWNLVTSLGPSGVLLLFWWLERTERLELQKRYDILAERVLTGLNDTKVAVASLKELLQVSRRDRE